jgi:rare lipoprotein A
MLACFVGMARGIDSDRKGIISGKPANKRDIRLGSAPTERSAVRDAMEKSLRRAAISVTILFCLAGSNTSAEAAVQKGVASWYGPGFHGRQTASGEIFDTNTLTAAHRRLPFGTRVRVLNERNGRSVVVRINDRGPYVEGRVIDLAKAAAMALGIEGTDAVTLLPEGSVSPLVSIG